MAEAKRDNNMVPTLIGVSNVDGITPVVVWVDPVTHRVLTSATGGGAGDMILANIQTVTGAKTFNSGKLILAGATSGTTIFNAAAVAGSTTITLPDATTTLVGTDTTQTLTNKSIVASQLTGTIATARLGAGSADATTYLRGDQTWVAISSGTIVWNEIVGTSQTAAINNGYIANNAALVTITLPGTAAVGSIIKIAGKGAGLWSVAQPAANIIHYGDQNTTTGVTGSLNAVHRYDAVELLCIVANTEWVVLSSQGNITVT